MILTLALQLEKPVEPGTPEWAALTEMIDKRRQVMIDLGGDEHPGLHARVLGAFPTTELTA